MLRGTLVGALACQKDSYLKSFTTSVLQCIPIKNGKYEVELEDTILFPEGGGQPCDLGTFEIAKDKETTVSIHVSDVQRKNLKAIHIIDEEISIGSEVKVSLDWRRRLDHMQQHTGQHLFSAILDTYNLPTLSWNMGEVINYIEIDRQLSEDEVTKITDELNDAIFNNVPIKVETKGDVEEEEKGVMRVIHIGELDSNPCCGTHLSNVGQIKGISIIGQTKSKGGKWKINFLCGDRIFRYLAECYDMNRKVGAILNSSLDKLDIKAEEVVSNSKKIAQRVKKMGKEIAAVSGNKLCEEIDNSDNDKKKTHVFYREDGDLDFLNGVYNEIKEHKGITDNAETVVVLASGDGAVVVCGGSETSVMQVVSEMSVRAEGREGGLKGGYNKKQGRYQGRVSGGIPSRDAIL